MHSEYKKILDRGFSQQALLKKFLIGLTKRKIPKFDRIVQKMHEEIFESIDCTQCANCCRELGPRLTTTDVSRIAGHLDQRESTFAKLYLLRDEDNDMIFKTMPCPFVEEDGQCRIYEERPRACANYPHTNEKNVKIMRLAKNMLYCPAVVLIVERLKAEL